MEGKVVEESEDINNNRNWSEKVEDLIDGGDTVAAISLLETLIPCLTSQSQLSSALFELSKLYSSKGFSLKSDDLLSRATALQLRSHSEVLRKDEPSGGASSSIPDEAINDDKSKAVAESSNVNIVPQEASDDDWEAIADRAPDELLSVTPQNLPEVSKLSLNDTNTKSRNRRGRGTFTYRKQGLYSDHPSDESTGFESPDEDVCDKPEKVSEPRNCVYGTQHVLVLDGFQPSTTTTDLEKLFEDFKDRGFAIRWVNDTLALAVFRSPAVAHEACDNVNSSFPVRVLNEYDSIMSCISIKDLEPPRQRPKTSARTAQRLIAQELGVKLPSNFGARELRSQEDARRNRIVTRQNLRDEAWGPDDTK